MCALTVYLFIIYEEDKPILFDAVSGKHPRVITTYRVQVFHRTFL